MSVEVTSSSSLEQFNNVMEYKSTDRVPNWEAGIWGQTRERWLEEGAKSEEFGGDWFSGVEALGMDLREFIPVKYHMMPQFEHEVLEKTEQYEIFWLSLQKLNLKKYLG